MMLESSIYFSVSSELLPLNVPIEFDIYINSSVLEKKEHFVKLYSRGCILNSELLQNAKIKYRQFYLNELDRHKLLQLLPDLAASGLAKANFAKSSAINYLEKLLDPSAGIKSALVDEVISDCVDSVGVMVQILKGNDFFKVQKLISELSVHDFYTFDHSVNVSMYCISMYTTIKRDASKAELLLAGVGGLLHDIGKLKLGNGIINKPTTLTKSEQLEICQHPRLGYELLKNQFCTCTDIDFNLVRRVVHEHHENFDGSGYPNRLSGSQIHFMSRVTSLADVFDALTTKRTYQKTLSYDQALQVMFRSKDKKFDPQLLAVFARRIDRALFNLEFKKELPADFDPCQPKNVIQFINVKKIYKGAIAVEKKVKNK